MWDVKLLTSITVVIAGLLTGNWLTTFYYRLSNNLPVNGHAHISGIKPHCSSCLHPLTVYEYLPIISLFATKWRWLCNYCGQPIDKTYTFMEIVTCLLFILNYAVLGINDLFIIVSAFSALLILSSVFVYHNQKIPHSVLLLTCFVGSHYRTISDGSIDVWLFNLAFIGVVFLLWPKLTSNIYTIFPIVGAACCLENKWLLFFTSAAALSSFFLRRQKWSLISQMGFIYLLVLFNV